MAKAIDLVWYTKAPKGWRRFPVRKGANGRIRLGWVMVEGTEVHLPNGRFEIRRYEGGKVVYEPAGSNAADAQAALERKRHLLLAKASAKAAGVTVEDTPERDYIRRAAHRFAEDAKGRDAQEAAEMNQRVLNEFIACTPKTFVDELCREDFVRFTHRLKKQGLSDRTIANKDARLRAFMRFCGAYDEQRMPPKPRYEKKLPHTYAPEDVRKLLKAAKGMLRLVLETGLKTGLREQELMHLEWADIDFTHATLRVIGKPHYCFKIKDNEQRELPVPADLLADLLRWQEKHPESSLVFPTKTGRPNGKLLRALKRLAKRSGLNCGTCVGCKSATQECRLWGLHTLRRTYCTVLIRNGIDVATAQRFMGHADLATTMRYIRPAQAGEAQDAINSINWS